MGAAKPIWQHLAARQQQRKRAARAAPVSLLTIRSGGGAAAAIMVSLKPLCALDGMPSVGDRLDGHFVVMASGTNRSVP
ncbi:MAG: hypothetical protein EOS11_00545 [Mesorhizobium sp.]|uniref:hypothetical protein n=1 Tax=Mesorhizobium sp. TaxID=1871066 RepID=UPI000FE3A8BE|nr:hypothetical protein [Mesorhizobium sp.]RWO31860.1 MAG: hypothetical protein EOS10_12625 [Mesorhizobium sp.]RWO50671.1 MAG: hypothetical protein EOS11_00545 [Mesorhizobium sp.]TIN79597.1 MAG: hypothetical protein E5Y09_09325 [Mesorhizobium sp.]TJV53267.1 MAG: hypothetical protein E5Y18_06485 [Mesorhizobium sp.]